MISGLEKGVVGMAVGESKTLTVPPEDANHPLAGRTLQLDVQMVEIMR